MNFEDWAKGNNLQDTTSSRYRYLRVQLEELGIAIGDAARKSWAGRFLCWIAGVSHR
jgi:hypothetical protein